MGVFARYSARIVCWFNRFVQYIQLELRLRRLLKEQRGTVINGPVYSEPSATSDEDLEKDLRPFRAAPDGY